MGKRNRIQDMFKPDRALPRNTPQGAAGYDNPRDVIDPHVKTQVVSSREGIFSKVLVDHNGDSGSSTSVGGAVLIENTGNSGAGLVIYSNKGATSGRLMNIRANNSAFDQAALHVDYDGVGNAVEIITNNNSFDVTPLSITHNGTDSSAIGVTSDTASHGVIKVRHNGDATTTNASGLSIRLQNANTACQGVFVDSPDGGATGDLLNLRNNGSEMFNVESDGTVISASTVDATGYKVSTVAGVSGNFTTVDGKTVTVSNGIITSIV